MGDTVQVEAALHTPHGRPLPWRKIRISYNDEWAWGMAGMTDSSGRVRWDLPLRNNRLSSCCLPGTTYAVHALFMGDGQYAREEVIGYFAISEGGDGQHEARFRQQYGE